jgi:hypothetical protein
VIVNAPARTAIGADTSRRSPATGACGIVDNRTTEQRQGACIADTTAAAAGATAALGASAAIVTT